MPIFNRAPAPGDSSRPGSADERDPVASLVDLTQQLVQNLTTTNLRYLIDLLCQQREQGARIGPIVAAVEAGRTLSLLGEVQVPGYGLITARQLLDTVLKRADDPGEALAYWLTTYGKPIPKWLKRAIGDAILRLYTPENVAAFDGQEYWLRFADVIELSDINRSYGDRTGLFRTLLDDRPRSGTTVPA